jgi:hypothetical protein
MSAPAVAPIAADSEETLHVTAPSLAIDCRGIVEESTWRAAILASAVILICLIACFVVMNWICCVG